MMKRTMALTRSQKWNRPLEMMIRSSSLLSSISCNKKTSTTSGTRRAKTTIRTRRIRRIKSFSCNRKTTPSRVLKRCLKIALKAMKQNTRSARMETCKRHLKWQRKMDRQCSNSISKKMLRNKMSQQ